MKGLAVGNGITDYHFDVWPAFIPTAYQFNIIQKELYDLYNENNCFFTFNDAIPADNSVECQALFDDVLYLQAGLNWYDLYRPVYGDLGRLKAENRMGEVEINGVKKTYKRGFTLEEYAPWLKDIGVQSNILLGDAVTDYINEPAVREALNIPDEAPVFEQCAS